MPKKKLAANKIALYLANNPKDVNTFDLGGFRDVEHPEGKATDTALRIEIKKMFTKFKYINDLHNNLDEKSKFKKSLKKSDDK